VDTAQALVVKDLVLLWCLGLRPVLVHGGGPEINKWLTKLNIEPNFSPSGLRVTDKDTMDIVEMVLVGRVNKSIVALIEQCGGKAVGLCGKDAGLVKAEIRYATKHLGCRNSPVGQYLLTQRYQICVCPTINFPSGKPCPPPTTVGPAGRVPCILPASYPTDTATSRFRRAVETARV
jgi:hypothetical protein